MTFNIGVIIGPILGGILSDPAGSYPDVFGGVPFFEKFPYATPNIVSSFFLLCAAVAVWLGLEETLDSLRDGTQDLGFRLGKKLTRSVKGMFKRSDRGGDYQSLLTEDVELNGEEAVVKPPVKRYTQRLAFRRIFTRNVALTLFAQFFLNFHVWTFNSLWFVFMSTPV